MFKNLMHYFTPRAFLAIFHKLSTQSMTFVFSFLPTQKQPVHKTSAGDGANEMLKRPPPQQQQFSDNKFTYITTTTFL
jgi:hypothetical protein